MATKKAEAPKKDGATAGITERLSERDTKLTWEPNKAQRKIASYIKRRSKEMQDFRRGLGIEQRWKEADEEYVPHELDFGTTRKRFETDQDTGLRSRMVPVGDSTQQWRQASSAPTLLSKIHTALSIIIGTMPEAELTALERRYEKRSAVAYSLWKRNWQITNAREKLVLTVFNLFKYGWAAQRTYPRLVKYDKRVLTEVDPTNPDNNKYEERENTWFNDVDREPLEVARTWIDELSKPYDPYSTNEAYFEIDYAYDAFKAEFGKYPDAKYVPRDSYMPQEDPQPKGGTGGSARASANADLKTRRDIVTVGFFESRHKDLFSIYIPKHGITVFNSPLPNDDGYLSVTHTLYLLRSSKLPYGVSLWEILRQNKGLYDKWKNMTMDQLVLSIMKFGFFSGTSTFIGDGKVEIVPGQARQITSSTGKPEINWMEIPGPGQEAWKGGEFLQAAMDDDTGISPTLEGEVTGKTLGEILHAKEAAMKRLKVPIENIAWLIEQDAYLSLSWMSQLYAIPTVKEFVDVQELVDYEKENEVDHYELFARTDEAGETVGIQATYLPQLALHLEDREGQLEEGKESRFFSLGKDIQPHQIKWRGIFKVIPRSIIDSSQELVKATKMEVFNMLVPLLAQPPEIFAPAVKQLIKIHEEDPRDWLPQSWLDFLDGKPPAPPAPGLMPPAGAADAPGVGGTMQDAMGAGPNQGGPTVVPPSQVTSPSQTEMRGGAGIFNRGL